ncbi:MAG TPA: enolase C-terminal domain-like protein, partial [Candidatus Polarisedimenticolaceae bacterium]|nr:enolase C-terminal domain-like protein [Candidatus Polarisedimenticolaceae bacterium]
EQITQAFDSATRQFRQSDEYQELVSGHASVEIGREFLRNVFRTHYLSSHIVALCFASLPSTTAELLKENLLEEMGRSDTEKPHSALLLELASGVGFGQSEIDGLIADARQRLAVFCATRVPVSTLRELCLAVLLETMSFEFMLSRCSSEIAAALTSHYGFAKMALHWFALHSEVDVRHAEEGVSVIQDYLSFHQIPDDLFDQIANHTLGGNLFARHYFPARSKQRTGTRSAPAKARRIEAMTIYRLRIPFHQTFRHALHSREESDAVIVKVTDSNGRSGFGESLPRSYVSGETTESMIARIREHLAPRVFAQSFAPGWETFECLQPVVSEWTRPEERQSSLVAWNAAFCAVELALLDWSLRADQCALADLLPPARYEVVYSGVISADAPNDAAALAKRMARFGIRQMKVKLGTADDAARLEAVRKAVGGDVALRADANGAWAPDEAIQQLQRLARFKLQVIEQPVRADDLAGMKRVRQESGVAIMADESLVTLDQARRLIELGTCDYFNIRLSKNGGISGSLAIARLAQEAGIKIQVGAQVGETGILSAAGRTLAAHLPALAFAEGSFGTWLLAEDVTFENVAFGLGGRAPLLQSRGLSVTVKEDVVERLATSKIDLRR